MNVSPNLELMAKQLNCVGECARPVQRLFSQPSRPLVTAPAEARPESAQSPRRPVGWIVLLVVVFVLLLLALLGPSLFGRALLARLGGPYQVGVQSVSGPIWAPTVSGLSVSGPGVKVQAGAVQASLSDVSLFGQTAKVNLSVADATVALKLKTLLGGAQGAAGGGFKLLPGRVDIRNTRLVVDGSGFNVPSGTWTAQSTRIGGQDAVQIKGATTYGALDALLKYQTVNGEVQASADFGADARIVNEYWHDKGVGGVTGGRITGRYTFGGGPVQGDVQLSSASVAVPGASFVTVGKVSGTVRHRGDLITLALAGTGFQGPVRASGKVDLKAHLWDMSVTAAPQLSALGKALGQGGKGVAAVKAHIYGWNTVTADADITSPQGEFSVLPFKNLRANYHFFRDTALRNNDLTIQADTQFQGNQKLSGKWTFNRAGTFAWNGNLLSKPLALSAKIDSNNLLRASGQALGGPLRGSLGLRDKAVTLAASPDFYSVSGDLSAQGTLDRLNLVLKGGKAGPVPIAGTAVFGKTGLKADLGAVQLDLDRQLRGNWSASGLNAAGVNVSGSGRLRVPEGSLTGQLSAAVPLLSTQPSGPISLNWQKRVADWTFEGGTLTWRNDTFAVNSVGLSALGYALRGDIALTTALKASGTLTASGPTGTITARGLGDRLALTAVQRGVTVTAETLLKPGFPTSAQVQGTQISGTISVDQNVRFTLNTAGQTARGTLALSGAQNWDATGTIDLAALRPLVGGTLSGTARLNLAGQGGTVQVAGSGYGATVNGVLTRTGNTLSAQTDVGYGLGTAGRLNGQLSGRIFPDLNLGGPVTVNSGTYGNQTVQARLSGPYGNVQASVNGTLNTVTAGGVTLPAQPLALRGQLTPVLNLAGSYGKLNLAYAGGVAKVQGTQMLSALGQNGQVRLHGSYGPAWAGTLALNGNLGPYALTLNGPWQNLNTVLTTQDGLRAAGTLNAQTLGYDLNVNGPLAGLTVNGRVRGTGANPSGTLTASDGQGGNARITVRGLQDFQVQASGLSLAGQKLVGTLNAAGGLLSGDLAAGPLHIVAVRGLFTASGTLYSHTLQATGKLKLPSTLSNINLKVTGPTLNVAASGSGTALRGTVQLRPQVYGTLGTGALASLPAQLLPLRASVTPLSINVGGLSYVGGRWSGQASLKYAALQQPGTLMLLGTGNGLAARPTGPLTGRLTVLPALGGTLSAPVSPFLPLLPAQLRGTIVPGRLNATVQPSSAVLLLTGTTYLSQPLGLSATASWNGGLRASAVLTHPGTSLPLRYDGKNLTISSARLDALALRPFLGTADVSGSAQADLTLPNLKLDRAQGRLKLDVRAAGQRAQGTVNLNAGTLSADLSSTLGGQNLRLRGGLYPQADASLSYGELRARLLGDLRKQASLDVSGSYAGKDVALRAMGGLNPALVQLSGTVAGLNLNLRAAQAKGSPWQVGGTFAASDLTQLAGTAGTLSGTVQGLLTDLRLSASGRAAGADFSVPARYSGGVLSVQAATAALKGVASARISGTIFPALRLSGPVTLSDYLPGTYTLSAAGALSKPDLRVSGLVSGGRRGLDAAGSRIAARLLGKDYSLTATGEKLSGSARGQLGNVLGPAGLLSARFNIQAPYRSAAQTFTLNGLTGWSQSAGFLGELRLGARLSGKPLEAVLRGNGTLSAEANVGSLLNLDPARANLSALFPASLPLRPGGTVTLRSLDVGALWQRPDQLGVTAQANISGPSWARLNASLQGTLNDAAGELSGAFSVRSQGGAYSLVLAGRKLSGSASLNAGEYRAQLRSSGVSLSRLLPDSAGVSALTLLGQADVTGSLAGGLRELRASNLDVRGVQTQAGPFSLTGAAVYTPQQTQADLSGTVFGGTLSAVGRLPQGVKVELNGLKPTTFGIDSLGGTLTLTGPASRPFASGRLNIVRPELSANLDVSGRLTDPVLLAATDLKAPYSGRVLVQVRDLRLSPPAATVHLYGAAATGGNRVNLDMAGQWPRLTGRATAQVAGLTEPITLQGDGQGSYALGAGTLGSGTVKLNGFVPTLDAALHLTPLAYVKGTGDASADLSVRGGLSALMLQAQVNVGGAAVSGVQLDALRFDVAGALTGPQAGLGRLTGTLIQRGKQIGALKNGNLAFTGLQASGAGLTATTSGRVTLSGTGSAAVNLAGAGVNADLKAAYAGGSVALSGTATASGVSVNLNSTGSLKNGWTGTLALNGGPAGVLTAPGRFALSGPLTQPLLSGQLGLGGAGVRLVANPQNVQLRLVDGPGVQASGVLNLDLARSLWSGQAQYKRPEASLNVKLSGAAGRPQASLNLTRGEWKISGTAGTGGADLDVSDGTQTGKLRWDGQTLGVNLPGLALGGLNLGTLAGQLSAAGTVDTRTLDGTLRLAVGDLKTGYTVPSVNLPLNGDISSDLTLRAGQLGGKAILTSSIGTAALTVAQALKGGPYSGSLKAKIAQPDSPAVLGPVNAGGLAPQPARVGGTLAANLTLDASGLKGSLTSAGLNLNLGGLNAHLNGNASLDGRSFTVQATANSDRAGSEAQVSLSGSGGLADLLPELTSLAGIQPTGDGYNLRASLNALELQGLKVAPNLSGPVSGEASVSDGGGTFVLRSGALKLGDTTLSARFEGTLVGDGSLVRKSSLLSSDWRIRGVVGNGTAATSQLSGSLSGGVLSGTFQLRGLPVDAFLSAFSGTLPGRGQLTGLARFRLPLADPLAGEVNVVAERLTVSSTMSRVADTSAAATTVAGTAGAPPAPVSAPETITQTLTGSGFVRYANRELQNIDLHLSGAGRWDVTGQYTRRAVGVTASFQNTTFTPVLLLIPSLRDQAPSLQGTLNLSVAGTYDRPVGNVSGSGLQGALGGISLRIPSLSGQLPDTGLFSARAGLQTGGTLGADGNLQVTGRLDNLKLSGLNIVYAGLLIPQGLGRIENVTATLSQTGAGTPSEGYSVQAQAVGGLGVGRLDLTGNISPLYDLKLRARNFNLPISLIYGRQSRINADLSVAEQGLPGAGGPINVTGTVNIASLLLGRGNTAAVIPAPASAGGGAGAGAGAAPSSAVNYQSPLPEELTTFPQPRQVTVKKVSPLLSRVVFLDVPISAPSGIRVDESIARAELSGNLVLAGTGSAPTLSGEVKAIRGSVDLRDNSFNIDTGTATFGGTSLYPVLAVSATGDVPLPEGGQVGVNLTLDGRFAQQEGGSSALAIDTRLSCVRGCVAAGLDLSASNPNAEAELYSLVAVGTPNLATLPSNLGTLGTSALKTALNLFVLGEVQRNIARALGVDVFRINAALPGENGSSSFGATFTVGSYLTRQLYLQYRVDLTGQGLLDATYTTPNNLFTFKASTPIQGFDLSTLRPSFSASYNLTNRSSVQLGVQSGSSTKVNFGYVYRW
jgi:TamB, inner membrane protein subunit of TAM complex